ncbi:GntR family transcriptional regulator [Mucilaginibacter yixingensis]|uniref:GntR family transcriptional regulator n=1 Tax=Mucilaginibacter yixingensis TaxID=1295612 RepID=A0A2T5JGG3_9SPHI|nr:GntR family transcriptional regulator [Mucilaginibacter yixingensis]PTR01532.1 GntR family transcriptional regulator [Mucilaginibacter yixingensis]
MSPIILDSSSGKPKYQQIISSVMDAIDNGELRIGDKIASVNEVAESTGVARKTVVQAFEHLKQAGLITSVQYKGYFVASHKTDLRHNIFVLFNNLTAYKEEIYESIKDALADKGVVDIYFHHDNADVFNTLIEKSAGKYTAYVIMPVSGKGAKTSLDILPQDKVYILDIGYADWGKKYPSVCQYFEMDIYDMLTEILVKIRKYQRLVLVSGNPSRYNAIYTQKGFMAFCAAYGFAFEIIEHVATRVPQSDELYIVVEDADLVQLVKAVRAANLRPGKNMGIISYNEYPLKELIGEGIATISTNFGEMGRNITDLILNRSKAQIRNQFRLIDRKSF